MIDLQKQYVVIFFDRWDEESVSFVLGPYDALAEAQAGVALALERMSSGYRRTCIEVCRASAQIPDWECEA